MEWREAQARARNSADLAALSQRKAETEIRAGLTLVAPIAGEIAAVTAQSAQPALAVPAVATIMPQGSLLEASLFVPTSAIGFIKPGQEVRLRYDAFAYQKFGSFKGRVTEISKTVLTPRELGAGEDGPPVFRVKVALPSDRVKACGEEWLLQAGMMLKADLVLERRRLWEWALEPLRARG